MLNRTLPPVKFKNVNISIPEVESTHLQNGVPIHYINLGNQPFVKIELVFRGGGSWNDNKVGSTMMLAKTLQSGTSNYNAEEISEFIARKGAHLEISPSFDFTILSLYTLNKYLDTLLPLILDISCNSTFPEDELRLQKEISISNLRIQNKKTNIVASKEFRNILYGSNHPYGQILTEQLINDINPKDVLTQFSDFFSSFEIIVSGKIENDVKTVITNHFEAFKSLNKTVDNSYSTTDKVPISKHIPVDGAIQTSLKIGKRIIHKSHQDYPNLVITNHLLGGFFGSRLMSNLREEKGLTYGIHSSIVSLKKDSFFSIASDINGSDRQLAITEINKELGKLSDTLVEEKELELVKNHLVGSFQADISSALAVSEKFKNIYLYDIRDKYYEEYLDRIKTVTPDIIKKTAQKYLHPDSMNVVTVGA